MDATKPKIKVFFNILFHYLSLYEEIVSFRKDDDDVLRIAYKKPDIDIIVAHRCDDYSYYITVMVK